MQRLTWLELGIAADRWPSTSFGVDDVEVTFGPPLEGGEGGALTVGLSVAELPLSRLPQSEGEYLIVPEAERLKAEAVLEEVADLLAVMSGCSRSLLSPPGYCVAFVPVNSEEREWLESHAGLAGSELGVSRARWSPTIHLEDLVPLGDRADGVSMLAQAVGQNHDPSRFRELVRFFERAFAESSDRLVPPLAEFLLARPVFEYSKSEVKRWIVRLRGPVVHADREKALIREREIEWVTDRMLFGAYDVLMNKRAWRTTESVRRNVWKPSYGPLNATTHVVTAGALWNAGTDLRDQFGSYRVSMSTPTFALPSPSWPSTKHHIEWLDGIKVVDSEEMEEVVM